MKTLKQQIEISFKLLNFTDKVIMLPIMDALASSIKRKIFLRICNKAINEDIDQKQAKKIFKVLSDLGCRTSLGENYEDIIKSLNSQEEQEEQEEHCILQLFTAGQNKLKAIKILRQQLNVSTINAKKLVDSCPINIDLRQYSIKQTCYEDLLYALKKIDCECSLTTKEQ